jgi:tetratricopeptide (TPR) repeat protein
MTTSVGEAPFLEERDPIPGLIQETASQFRQTIRSYVAFNLLFVGFGALEFLLLLLSFTFWVHSSFLAFTLASIFLTLFSYFIFRLYFQTRKPELFNELRTQYLDSCREAVNTREAPERHLAVANASYLLASELQGKEESTYSLPPSLSFLARYLKGFSRWWHWYDFHKMREMLLQAMVDEQIELIKCEPTSLEAHVGLANGYVLLSSLYVDPGKLDGFEEEGRMTAPRQFLEILQQKFRATAERAIEEFKILNEYAPNDPWVHAQLAYSYHDLQMPLEEIMAYETIMKLRPDDKETLFKLGTLYFQQGMNAQGLRVYEELKKTHFKKAESLIQYYGQLA